MSAPLKAVLRHQRAVTIAALGLLAMLAWGWLLLGAGMRMGTHLALDPFPYRTAGDAMPMDMGMVMGTRPGWTGAQFLLAFSMWWVMMVAMMLPAAAPVILLHARVIENGKAPAKPPTAWFVAGYLSIWGLFSLLAAALQGTLDQWDALAPMTMGLTGRWLAASVLVAAGLYQLSPFKESCLANCRNPASFLSRHYHPGSAGAFQLGLRHGAYCAGCCWLLMALLFVGGVMNLAWIALLTLLVAGEKLLPGGHRIALAAGLAFIAWGALTAFA